MFNKAEHLFEYQRIWLFYSYREYDSVYFKWLSTSYIVLKYLLSDVRSKMFQDYF